jgi:hypothetical protein
MIWLFTRRRAQLNIEVRRQLHQPGFELVISHPDRTEQCDRFSDAASLIERTLELQRRLILQGWHPHGVTGPGSLPPPSARRPPLPISWWRSVGPTSVFGTLRRALSSLLS